jgi:ectoine hydroxylase-related dioxygenase (phytanoyl-CoA dioxygenase family)
MHAGLQALHTDGPCCPAPPGAARFPWHGLGCVLLLDKFTETNGATRIVPHSHALEADPFATMEDALAPHPNEMLVLGEPGDALIYASNLWYFKTAFHSTRLNVNVHFTKTGFPQT